MRMLLHSGTVIDTSDVTPENITLRDIAWGLSRQVRFGGASDEEYTVAQHSVLMYRHALEKRYSMANLQRYLCHDFAEAYTTDIPTPWKARWPGAQRDEDNILRDVEDRFGMPRGLLWELPGVVKADDTMCMRYEASHLFPNTPAEVWGEGPVDFTPMSPWKVWNKDRAMAELLLACSEAGIR